MESSLPADFRPAAASGDVVARSSSCLVTRPVELLRMHQQTHQRDRRGDLHRPSRKTTGNPTTCGAEATAAEVRDTLPPSVRRANLCSVLTYFDVHAHPRCQAVYSATTRQGYPDRLTFGHCGARCTLPAAPTASTMPSNDHRRCLMDGPRFQGAGYTDDLLLRQPALPHVLPLP